ncbi:MAG TPA: DNA replication/repair protein RecF [Bacillota bacterium]|nr:DNA replication/repair protein RecF [Bacillota bacterium]
MIVTSIALTNFRNYKRLNLEVGPSVNVFYGANAQGKTNIIEGIYLCACAKSHRTTKDKELLLHGEHEYKVRLSLSASYSSYDESVSVEYLDENSSLNTTQRPKTIVCHDDVPFARSADYLGIFNAVIFAPEDLSLIKEGPSVRRRFLNVLISQVNSGYFHELYQYNRLLMSRNQVIKVSKSAGEKVPSSSTKEKMSFWDEALAKSAARIILIRYIFSLRLENAAKCHHERISGGVETLYLRYKSVVPVSLLEGKNMTSSTEDIEKFLLEKYAANAEDDYFKGSTSVGPQRDDLLMSLDGEGLRMFASQGQQRSAALSLKLAELDIMREETNDTPILLLDDVFSELDATRRACLLSSTKNAQVFITCTDKSFIEKELAMSQNGTEDIVFFSVSDGKVTRDS